MPILSSIRERLGRNRGRRVEAIPTQLRDPAWAWVPSPRFSQELADYAQRTWVNTAIDRIAEMCVANPLEVRSADGMMARDHPLLRLLGTGGRPNPYQDAREFMEAHFQRMDVFGNDVWKWVSSAGGAPDSVYQLDLQHIKLESDRAGTRYTYNLGGRVEVLSADEITHFRRASVLPTGVFWGMSSLDKIREMIESDASMATWNKDFFDNGAPNGVLLVDSGLVNRNEARELHAEMEENRRKGRGMMVLRASPGSASWADISLRHRDVDFRAGRMLTRQAVFDALGFHVGVVSEASTEAHAKVSERLVRNSAHARQVRTAERLSEALAFWPGADQYTVRFTDVRVVDWEQEQRKLESVAPYMTVNEVRSRYLDLAALPGYDKLASEMAREREGSSGVAETDADSEAQSTARRGAGRSAAIAEGV